MDDPRRKSPSAWLWEEITRRFGAKAARELHDDYIREHRAYGYARLRTPESPDSSKRVRSKKRRK